MNNPNLKLLYLCINQNEIYMDTTGLCLWPTMAESFRSKADVVKFALLTSAKVDNGVTEIDYSKA